MFRRGHECKIPRVLKAHAGNFCEVRIFSLFTLCVFVVLITAGVTFSLRNGRPRLFECYSFFSQSLLNYLRVIYLECNLTTPRVKTRETTLWKVSSNQPVGSGLTCECGWVTFHTNLRPQQNTCFSVVKKPDLINPTWPELILRKATLVYSGGSKGWKSVQISSCAAWTLPRHSWLCPSPSRFEHEFVIPMGIRSAKKCMICRHGLSWFQSKFSALFLLSIYFVCRYAKSSTQMHHAFPNPAIQNTHLSFGN